MDSTELSHSSDRVCRLCPSPDRNFIVNILLAIQETADMNGKLTQSEISMALDFCLNAFQGTAPEERESVPQKLKGIDPKTKRQMKI
jgi:hypothetical protein